MAQSEPFCLFPIYRVRTVYVFFILHRQLEHREEQFAEFDSECIEVESWTVPLTPHNNEYVVPERMKKIPETKAKMVR